ncbi:MAG: (Fe-S)-binding protein, partial [Planctomycetota bacterium]
YRELPGPDHCCGAAGLYLARRPRTSRKVGDEAFARWEAATAHQPASGIVSGNAGCLMRWETLLREDSAEAVHPVVLLDRAYDAP